MTRYMGEQSCKVRCPAKSIIFVNHSLYVIIVVGAIKTIKSAQNIFYRNRSLCFHCRAYTFSLKPTSPSCGMLLSAWHGPPVAESWTWEDWNQNCEVSLNRTFYLLNDVQPRLAIKVSRGGAQNISTVFLTVASWSCVFKCATDVIGSTKLKNHSSFTDTRV